MPETHSTLFIPGDSRYHRLHPFNKLAYILLTGVTVYLGPGKLIAAACLIILNAVLAVEAAIFIPLWRALWRTLLPLALFMGVIHGIFNPASHTVLIALGKISVYQEGIQFTFTILLQLSAVLSASLLFAFCTHPADLITVVSQAGWPPALAYLLGSPLLLLPAMRERARTIQAAQQARGLETHGSFIQRFRAVLPLVAPLILGAIVEVEQRSIALEIRSFNIPGEKTSWRKVTDSAVHRFIRWAMMIAIAMIIAYRYIP